MFLNLNRLNLIYVIYICLACSVVFVFALGFYRSGKLHNTEESSNSYIEIIRPLNSPSGEYDYYIKNPKFQFMDKEGNIKVMQVLGLYVKIGSPVEVTCKVESVDKSFSSD